MELPPKGILTETNFIKLLLDSKYTRRTGMIRLETGPVIKVVYMQQGGVAFASSNEKSDRLTEVLKRAGKLTTEQIEHAQARLKPNVSLGKTLVELGYISPKDLLWGARMQVEGILHQLLFWDQGNYQVIEGPLPKEIVSLNMSVPSIIFDGILKSRDRHWVLQHIGSPESVFSLDPSFHEKNAVYKLPVDETVSRMNGRRSLEEIAQVSGQDTFDVCKAIAALQLLEMVQRSEMSVSVPIMVAEASVEEEASTIELTPAAPTQNISLGQVLQIPTVEELQQEPEEQPPSDQLPTMMIRPKESARKPIMPEPEEEAPTFHFEEEQDTENVAPEPAYHPAEPAPPQGIQQRPRQESIPMESMGQRRKSPKPYTRTVNWKKVAVIMGIFAVLTTAGTFVYTRFLQKPPAREYPAAIAPKPFSKPASTPETTEPAATEDQQIELGNEESEPEPLPAQQEPPTQPAVVAPQPQQTTVPAPVIAPPATPLDLVKTGRIAEASRAWKKLLLPKRSGYTIQLEIACQENTVLEAFQILNDSPQTSIVPLDYKGRACYRVLFGVYASTQEAESARAKLPQDFLKIDSPATVIPLTKALQ